MMDALKAVSRIIEREGLDVQWAAEYAEPGYNQPKAGIAFANWNPERYHRIADILEKCGVELEWSDEWATCSDCGKAIRTSPDCYSWAPYCWPGDGEILCGDCVRDNPEPYIEFLQNNPRASNLFKGYISPGDFGFEKLDDVFESGYHPGQDADPEKILAALREKGWGAVIFETDGVGQFDVRFSAWVRKVPFSQWD